MDLRKQFTLNGKLILSGDKIAWRIGNEKWKHGRFYIDSQQINSPAVDSGGILRMKFDGDLEIAWPAEVNVECSTCSNCGAML